MNIESFNTAYMHNVGRTACPDDHTCNQAVWTEVYNEEQKEILANEYRKYNAQGKGNTK